MGEQVDVIWFNSMGVFSEPIFSIGFMTLTMKQMVLLFGGLLMSYAMSAASPYAALAVAGIALLLAFYKPRVMPVEEYISAAIRFFMMHNSHSTEKKYIASIAGGVAETGQEKEEKPARSKGQEKPAWAGKAGKKPSLSMFKFKVGGKKKA